MTKEYREQHKERINEQKRDYREKNLERCLTCKYCKKNHKYKYSNSLVCTELNISKNKMRDIHKCDKFEVRE